MTEKVRIEDVIREAEQELWVDDLRVSGTFISFHKKERQVINRLEQVFQERFQMGKARALALASILLLRQLEEKPKKVKESR